MFLAAVKVAEERQRMAPLDSMKVQTVRISASRVRSAWRAANPVPSVRDQCSSSGVCPERDPEIARGAMTDAG